MKYELHWSTEIANAVIEAFPQSSEYTCAAGISPSGVAHIGNFRDLITADVVVRELREHGKEALLLFSWDDYDRFRKVPDGVPSNFSEYIGMPLVNVPDPAGEYSSYARRFEAQLEDALPKLGIFPKIQYQSMLYASGVYDDKIRVAMQNRRKIAEVLAQFKTQGMNKNEIETYYPIIIYSRFSGKDNTRITGYDGESKVTYLCVESGKTDEVIIGVDRNIKLSWRIDWPMRWNAYSVHFEPGGKDHSSAGGSYDVAKEISLQVFGRKPPVFQGYEFVRIRGLGGKMSSSSGNAISPGELLKIYEEHLLRWIFTRVKPEKTIDLAFDSEILRQYDEFDRQVNAVSRGIADPVQEKSIQLAFTQSQGLQVSHPMSFRQAVAYGNITDFKRAKLDELLLAAGEFFDSKSIDARLPKAQNWLSEYNPSELIQLRAEPDARYYASLDGESRHHVQRLRDIISSGSLSIQEIEKVVYEIPKDSSSNQVDNKTKQAIFFKQVYTLLLGRQSGPRLSTLIWASDKERLMELLAPDTNVHQ